MMSPPIPQPLFPTQAEEKGDLVDSGTGQESSAKLDGFIF